MTYSKSSKREREGELFKIQQERERGAMEVCASLRVEDVPMVVDTLSRAMGGEGGREEAERRLAELEKCSGFASCLAEIVLAGTKLTEKGGGGSDGERAAPCVSGNGGGGAAAGAVPWLASVHLKNVCSRRWRRDAKAGIDPDEKHFVRSRLREILVCEYNDAIAVQVRPMSCQHVHVNACMKASVRKCACVRFHMNVLLLMLTPKCVV